MTDTVPNEREHRRLRRDAQARRDALILAAAECFNRSGYLVPLEEVADRAGVGRGTLYRNFKDRMALAIAIFEREVTLLEAELDRSLPLEEAIVAVAARGSQTLALFSRLAAEMPLAGDNLSAFEALGLRFATLLQPLVDRAHVDRRLRPEVGARDIVLVVRMIGGLLQPFLSQAEKEAVASTALSLILTGLRPAA